MGSRNDVRIQRVGFERLACREAIQLSPSFVCPPYRLSRAAQLALRMVHRALLASVGMSTTIARIPGAVTGGT